MGGHLPEVIECEDFFPLLALQLDVDPSVLTESLLYGCQKLEVQGKWNECVARGDVEPVGHEKAQYVKI